MENRKIAIFEILCIFAIVCLLPACGKKEPGADDAKKYVGAVLDLMCKGEYDSTVDLSGLKDEEVSGFRDEMIDEMLFSFADDTGMDEEMQGRFREYLNNAFSKCRYSVEEAVKSEAGGYDVTVSIEPLKLFAGTEEALQKEMENMTSDTEALLSMPEEEVYQLIHEAMFKALNANLDNPAYAESEKVTVHYGVMNEEDNTYGLDEEAGERLGEKLFSSEGLE